MLLLTTERKRLFNYGNKVIKIMGPNNMNSCCYILIKYKTQIIFFFNKLKSNM